MEKTYTMQDVAAMTGLTTRTLRSYQQQGFLRGEKENGVWRFTDEALEGFFQNPAVLPAIRAGSTASSMTLCCRTASPGTSSAPSGTCGQRTARPSPPFSAARWSAARGYASPSFAGERTPGSSSAGSQGRRWTC